MAGIRSVGTVPGRWRPQIYTECPLPTTGWIWVPATAAAPAAPARMFARIVRAGAASLNGQGIRHWHPLAAMVVGTWTNLQNTIDRFISGGRRDGWWVCRRDARRWLQRLGRQHPMSQWAADAAAFGPQPGCSEQALGPSLEESIPPPLPEAGNHHHHHPPHQRTTLPSHPGRGGGGRSSERG